MTEDERSKRVTARSFGDAADAYLESRVHGEGADLDRLASWCRDAGTVLDVATGAGHAAGAIAERGVEPVGEEGEGEEEVDPAGAADGSDPDGPDERRDADRTVVAVDAAPEMVATAVDAFDGVVGAVGDAEELPFAADSVDAVCCRIAAHHFPDPEGFVAEVARVLRPGGTFAFEDNVAPEDPALATFLDRVERLRDPTHVESHPTVRWRQWLTDAGFRVEGVTHLRKSLDFEGWTNTQSLSAEERDRVERELLEAPPEAATAFDIRRTDGSIESFANPKALIRARLAE